ncbi:Na+/H+ antiporter subunit E [Nesterenkonia flava]|uniref:Na+/H+ antiporter subunit E n=1 Tax=Nesterenkonia flava TaxID=469799 RepID=A0ABU1FXG0_9MICC|nr:Na+/H+ antiporter subunit E [Nesterenkonia flava]MDR5712833.1 Na+/H+ antiporter subunit E [Nesterenkonia flava]
MRWLTTGVVRAALVTLLWIFFAGWNPEYVAYGMVSIAAATALSLWLLPPREPSRLQRWPLRVWFSAVLFVWFLGQSVAGGVDVAVRALRRPVKIEPAVVVAPLQLPEGHARQRALLMMNLMPGSMIQRVTDGAGDPARVTSTGWTTTPAQVELHTLSASLNPAAQWQSLQQKVSRAME